MRNGAGEAQSEPHSPTVAYVALGSNLGDREAHLRRALEELGEVRGVRVLRVSTFHETEPMGGPAGQGRYVNAVVEIETTLAPRELLAKLLEVETRHGRVRTVRDGPRTLDLDLLLYNNQRIDEPGLTVPHPRMWQREFVVKPLGELLDIDALRARWGA